MVEKINEITKNGGYKDWEQDLSTLLESEPVAQMLAGIVAFDQIVTQSNEVHAAVDIGIINHDFGEVLDKLRKNMAICNLAQKSYAKPGPNQTRSSMISSAMRAVPLLDIPQQLRAVASKILGKT